MQLSPQEASFRSIKKLLHLTKPQCALISVSQQTAIRPYSETAQYAAYIAIYIYIWKLDKMCRVQTVRYGQNTQSVPHYCTSQFYIYFIVVFVVVTVITLLLLLPQLYNSL